mmetsp:Transcript_31023/g.99117  ORF Transcript_31023/g.99117 Transcript_31023/m.99117 type:complete len:446 (-) Transcript_31023:394-1731(-)
MLALSALLKEHRAALRLQRGVRAWVALKATAARRRGAVREPVPDTTAMQHFQYTKTPRADEPLALYSKHTPLRTCDISISEASAGEAKPPSRKQLIFQARQVSGDAAVPRADPYDANSRRPRLVLATVIGALVVVSCALLQLGQYPDWLSFSAEPRANIPASVVRASASKTPAAPFSFGTARLPVHVGVRPSLASPPMPVLASSRSMASADSAEAASIRSAPAVSLAPEAAQPAPKTPARTLRKVMAKSLPPLVLTAFGLWAVVLLSPHLLPAISRFVSMLGLWLSSLTRTLHVFSMSLSPTLAHWQSTVARTIYSFVRTLATTLALWRSTLTNTIRGLLDFLSTTLPLAAWSAATALWVTLLSAIRAVHVALFTTLPSAIRAHTMLLLTAAMELAAPALRVVKKVRQPMALQGAVGKGVPGAARRFLARTLSAPWKAFRGRLSF